MYKSIPAQADQVHSLMYQQLSCSVLCIPSSTERGNTEGFKKKLKKKKKKKKHYVSAVNNNNLMSTAVCRLLAVLKCICNKQ